jgi:hypothetical protein
MKPVPTAEEFMRSKNYHHSDDYYPLLIEFAKLHLKAQNKAILENVRIEYYLNGVDEFGEDVYAERIKEDSITKAYPLFNIK